MPSLLVNYTFVLTGELGTSNNRIMSPTSGSERSLKARDRLPSSSESRKLSTSIWSKVYFPPFLVSPEMQEF